MSLSELFKPRLGSCGACAAPWPNVALVLQFIQALRVSPTLSKTKNENKSKVAVDRTFALAKTDVGLARKKLLWSKKLFRWFFFEQGCRRAPVTSSYDHTTVRAPHPIRTAKLSTVGPDQYFGRGLQGNLGCCMAFSFFCFAK